MTIRSQFVVCLFVLFFAGISPADRYKLAFSTFLGGNGNDAGRAGCVAKDASLIVAGASSGQNWPTKNPHQPTTEGPADTIIAKLEKS